MKAVLDIGKTNVKLLIFGSGGELVCEYSSKNQVVLTGDYPHADIPGIWGWFKKSLLECAHTKQIQELVITTHGATAALVCLADSEGDGLVMPVLDYEYAGVNQLDDVYNRIRPDFNETLSPSLPFGLNLGRQLFWLEDHDHKAFARADVLLMYPQYWAWRLTGVVATEVTSLGCHTDLWDPNAGHYSSMVEEQDWLGLMPPLRHAWEVLGQVLPSVAEQTGLPLNCKVYVGLHDSNASYLRYLANSEGESNQDFCVISSGTWTILMASGEVKNSLDGRKDMLANCDVRGMPVACARFMGGREYELICARLGGSPDENCGSADIQRAITNQWMVTPDFSGGNGPFGGLVPRLECPVRVTPSTASALAALYCALMIDQRLSDLGSCGDVYIEGAFLKNPLLCRLVAQLRPDQRIYLSKDVTGTVQGALLLTSWGEKVRANLNLEICAPADFEWLDEYRTQWWEMIRSAIAQEVAA
jgi:sugar (pentulose or hexulose) kinase